MQPATRSGHYRAPSPLLRSGAVPLDDLTLAQIRELKADLETLRRQLECALEAGAEGVKPVDLDLPIGRRSAEARLRQVRAALAALAGEDYGYCRECGEAVGYRRLKARPETPFCLGCQSGFEHGR